MAANKTQHFVPRCYLRPFTLHGENRAISLFNLTAKTSIADAPVKKQCAGDYFYGDDLVLEKLLQPFEAGYAGRLKDILAPGYELTEADAALLKEFWLLQYLRTDAASRTTLELAQQFDKDAGGLPPEYLITLKEAVQTAMRIFFGNRDAVADLGLRLVRNRTDRPFITSDNPAAMTNRWHFTDRRTDLTGVGLQSAGMLGLLPLSSEVLCLLYDRDLYSVVHTAGWTEASASAVIDAFNEQQILNCQSNIYFGDWDNRGYVENLVTQTVGGRLNARYELNHAVLEREENGTKVFRQVSSEEAKGHQHSIVQMVLQLPSPSAWPSIIKWRPGGVAYDSGNASGFARRATRVPSGQYSKIKVRP